jgi:hypothetical protein
MANASKDENGVSTLIGASTADGKTPVRVYADPTTHRLLVQNGAGSGIVAPATTPSYIGQVYVDTSAKKAYMAMGTASSADWVILN